MSTDTKTPTPIAWVGPAGQLMPHFAYEAWAPAYPDDAKHFTPLYAIPTGWKLVPIVPTQAMAEAYSHANPSSEPFVKASWAALLAATPEPVNPQGSYFAPDGTMMNADGTRSIFDDVDD